MVHASMRAALIDEDAATDRDAAIASALSQLALGETVTTELTGTRVRCCVSLVGHVHELRARSGHAEIVRLFGGLRRKGLRTR